MSRQFSIPTMLRMVPNELLQEFFRVLGHEEFDPDWEHLGQREFDPLLDYITDLPTSQAGEFDQELRAVYELSCQSGMTAIAEAAKLHGMAELPLKMPERMSVHGLAMWTRLRHPKIFETAQLLHEVDHLSWWRKRNDLPSKTPQCDAEALEKLERGVSNLLKEQGRGRLCTVEAYHRDNVHYFFAYPDDFSETANQHNDSGRLVPLVINKTMQVVFAYNSLEGSLETYAKLPKRVKENLESCFAQCILDWHLDEHVSGKTFEMNQLKDPYFRLLTDPQDEVAAEVVQMQLAHKTNGRKVEVSIDPTIEDDTIHKAIEQTIRTDVSPLSQWNVISVALHFEFLPKSGRRSGHQTIKVSFPNTCNVRSDRSERVHIIQKYLKLWNIDRGRPSSTSPVAVGA